MVEAGFGTVALIVHADLPAKNVAELIALAVASKVRSAILPDVVDKLTSLGIVVVGGSSEAAVARAAAEMAKWAGVIRKGNLQLG